LLGGFRLPDERCAGALLLLPLPPEEDGRERVAVRAVMIATLPARHHLSHRSQGRHAVHLRPAVVQEPTARRSRRRANGADQTSTTTGMIIGRRR
jgi:hypothetical protein